MVALGWLVALVSWIAVVPFDDRDPPPTPSTLLGTGKLESSHAKHIQGLIKQFQDPDASRRHQGIAAVVRIGDAAIPLLRERVEETSNPLIQRAALLALGEIGGVAAAASLHKLILSDALRDEELAVALLAYAAVARSAEAPVLERVSALAVARKPTFARRAAMLALGKLRARDAVAACLADLDRDLLDDQKVAVLIATAACADARFTEFAITALDDRADAVRRAACLAIAESGDSTGVERLTKMARTDRSQAVIVAAILALGRGSDARSLDTLLSLTQSQEEVVRFAAWSAIASRNDGAVAVTSAFEKALDPAVLTHLAFACSQSSSAALSQPLQALLPHSRAEIRAAAGCALALRNDRGAESQILKWVRGERELEARSSALLVVGALKFESARGVIAEWKSPVLRDRMRDVMRTLDGRRDPRLLWEEIDDAVTARRAREIDLRTQVFADSLSFVFQLDGLDRVKVVAGKPSGGSDSGSGDGGGDGGSTEGPLGGLLGKGRIDRKNSVVERDLELWFARSPYFTARPPVR